MALNTFMALNAFVVRVLETSVLFLA